MSTTSFYKSSAKYGDMDASMISQMKSLEDENRRLKRMFADLSMQADLKSLERSDGGISASRDGHQGSGASSGKHRVRPLSSSQWRKWAHPAGRPQSLNATMRLLKSANSFKTVKRRRRFLSGIAIKTSCRAFEISIATKTGASCAILISAIVGLLCDVVCVKPL